MTSRLLELPREVYDALQHHLISGSDRNEQAAFVFAQRHSDHGVDLLKWIEWFPVPPNGFASRSPFHFELTDEARAAVIKRAHDLSASVVEFHSHVGPWPPEFSASDWAGLEEFVPHVLWRLNGRPYAAVVVSSKGFDGVIWLANPNLPVRLDGILVEGHLLRSSGLSRLRERRL